MWRVALVSASPLVLAGLRAGLEQNGAFDVVLASASFEAARRSAFGHADMVLIDGDPAALAHDIDDDEQGPALVVLADDAEPELAEWLRRGVSTLPRNASIDAIAAAAHAAAAGLVATSPQLAAQALLLARHADHSHEPRGIERLTAREQEVLAKMSQGLGNREIAEALHISPHTAKFHVAQIIGKLDATSRAHAVAKAFRAGLVEP
jgi:DNA-binding NarL/FixJ family response regulator